jgi:cytochrome b561
MSLRSTETHWSLPSRALHWVTVLLLLVQVPLGAFMDDLPKGAQKVRVFALHKSIGLTILALVLLRVLWRLLDQRPAKVPMPQWQSRASTTLQFMLYVLLFAVPLSGWAMNSAAGFPLQWFGLFNLPALTAADKGLHELLEALHGWFAWTLVVLATGHGAAALKHHFIDKDHTLRAMLPRRRATGGAP